MKPATFFQISVRLIALLFLTGLVSICIGFALGSYWGAFLLFCFLVASFFLLMIWQENSLLLRAGTALELSPHQASQLAALESRVHHWAQVLSIATPPLVYWRTFPGSGAYLVRSLGSSGLLILDQGLFSQMSDAEWDQWIREALLRLDRPESVLRSFAQFWLGLVAADSWSPAEPWTPGRALKWTLLSPIRRFFVWFQL